MSIRYRFCLHFKLGMKICPEIPEISDHWPEVKKHLPVDFNLEATARARGAFTRARGVKDAETLLRLSLAYGGLGMSLRETCAWAEAGEIASLRDPSLFNRLCKAEPWLGVILAAMIAEQGSGPAARWAGYRLRALDGQRSASREPIARHGACMSATTLPRGKSISLN